MRWMSAIMMFVVGCTAPTDQDEVGKSQTSLDLQNVPRAQFFEVENKVFLHRCAYNIDFYKRNGLQCMKLKADEDCKSTEKDRAYTREVCTPLCDSKSC